MKKAALSSVLLAISTTSWGGESCTRNAMQNDVCHTASTISERISRELPLRIRQNLTLEAIRASGNVIRMTAAFDYTEEYLVSMAAKNGVTMNAMKFSAMQSAILAACRPNTELYTFIKLGGRLQFEYRYSDNAPYLMVNVDGCTEH